ncbi:HEAT repeat domain-containing protein [Streptomyces sp. NPDC056468]|uniref:HEAT repeat domain-containing protein n=1 Tax=Streptomyces sp. NPDC056468 TaxID=3345830 RepID=UPI00369D3C34
MDGTELVAAVRSGDAEAVRALLESGAAPDTVTDGGLPVLCLAVDAFAAGVAEALVEAGADPDRLLPDGTTPLVRAVEGGSPATVEAVLGREPRLRLPEAERERLLALARRLHESGAEDELRGRTGASGPAHRVRVLDDEYDHVDQLTLGGRTVRAGHSAILTNLEWAFRVLTPVDELVARAVAPRDPDHVAWASAGLVLSQRRSKETWSAVTAYRHSPDPHHRRFVVDVIFYYVMGHASWRNSYEKEAADLLVAWTAEGEEDPEVLAVVLRVLSDTGHRETEGVGLRYADHPDPRVRARVPDLLLEWEAPPPYWSPEARAALLVLAADEDGDVRDQAGRALAAAHDDSREVTDALVALLRDPVAAVRGGVAEAVAPGKDRTAAVADALAALLDEDEFTTRLNAAYGLLRRDDARTDEAIKRVGSFSRPGYEDDHRISALWTWQRQRDHPPTPAER